VWRERAGETASVNAGPRTYTGTSTHERAWVHGFACMHACCGNPECLDESEYEGDVVWEQMVVSGSYEE